MLCRLSPHVIALHPRSAMSVSMCAALLLSVAACMTHGARPAAGDVAAVMSRREHAFCDGPTCTAVSELLQNLEFKPGAGPAVECACPDFFEGRCFAPGCFPCAKECFEGDKELEDMPGPFGTGLLCSSGCFPCCQRRGDPSKVANSTCDLVGDGC